MERHKLNEMALRRDRSYLVKKKDRLQGRGGNSVGLRKVREISSGRETRGW